MKVIAWISVAATMVAATHAFSVTDCDNGFYHNYGQAGNKKCKEFSASNIRYDSNKNLKLHVYDGHDCQGKEWETDEQDICHKVPFTGKSIKVF